MKFAKLLCPLLANTEAFGDTDKSSIGIPKIGEDLTVSCEGTRMVATLMREYVKKNEQWLGNGDYISMGNDMNPDCKGKRDANGNIVLTIADDFTNCGTRVESVLDEDGTVTDYVFKNNIINDEADTNMIMVSRSLDILEFECVYPTIQMTTGEINPLVQSALAKSKTREIKGDMRLYKSVNYTDFYTEPPVLALEEILYVEVNLERPLVSEAFKASTDFAVVLEHCWGTPHNNRDGDMKYYIIKNQCPVKGDPSLKVEQNGDSLTGRFNIKMFKFIGDTLNDVWLHCTVRACNTTAASCVPDCDGNTRKRRGVNRRELPFVSLGHDIEAEFPIQRRNEGGEEIFIIEERNSNSTPLTPGTTSFNVMVVVAATVVVLVFVFAITCMVAKRRRNKA